MNPIAPFFAGVLFCNSIPHLAAGLRGEVFPTPFARPHGRGPSSPLVNVLWGGLDLLAALALSALHPIAVGLDADFAAAVIGALASGIFLSWHFGRQRADGAAWTRPDIGSR